MWGPMLRAARTQPHNRDHPDRAERDSFSESSGLARFRSSVPLGFQGATRSALMERNTEMAKSGRKGTRSAEAVRGRARWIVGVSALVLAMIAFCALIMGGGGSPNVDARGQGAEQVLDDIDAKSRKAMRDLLREARN